MPIKKIFTDYQAKANKIISQWQLEVNKAQSLGDDYINKIISVEKQREVYRYGHQSPPGSEEIKMFFEIQNKNVNWLKSFLLDNLSQSQIEPVYITYQGHSWYLIAFNRYSSFISERALVEGDALPAQNFYDYSRLNYPENYEHLWLYQDAIYGYNGQFKELFSSDEQKLLILENADKERKKFEKLKNRFSGKESEEIKYERTRIPEEVRIAVWRRDQGKCTRCGSRENLEYDHIVPVSKGGGNTVRNIELLCQDCNRSKGNRIE